MGSVNKPSITVTVDIHPGLASPVQMAAWRRFWRKVIADVNNDGVKGKTCVAWKDIKSEKA